MMSTTALRVLLLVALATPASAGLNDPPPTIAGSKMKHVYSVTGVVAYLDLGTIIHCTSLHREGEAIVAVEAYFDIGGAPRNDVSMGDGVVENVPPGGSVAIAITKPDETIAGLFWNQSISTTTIGRGSARVLTNSPQLLCTAALVDTTASPPASMVALHVFKKKQKGD